MTLNTKENPHSIYLAFGLTLILFGFLAGPTRFWTVDLTTVGISGKWFMIPGLLLSIFGFWKLKKNPPGLDPKINPFGAALVFPVILVADYFARSYSFITPEAFRGEILVLALLVAWMTKHSFDLFARVILPFGSLLLIAVFFWQAQGHLLLFDDHSAFFYRLQMLKENFPAIPHYNTMWNAGLDSRDYFATGVLNMFFIFAPLIYLFPLESIYNIIIVALLFIILPAASYYGARVLGSDKKVSAITAVLAMTAGLLWYRWCLKYGAMGFCTSLILLPLNVAFTLKLTDPDRELSKLEIVIFWFTLLCMSIWPLSMVAFLPIIVYVFYKIRTVWKKRYAKGLLFFFLICYIPWAVTFVTVSKVGSFVSLGSSQSHIQSNSGTPQAHNQNNHIAREKLLVKGKPKEIKPREVINHAREAALMTNPLIVFLSIPGFLLLARRAFWPYLSLVVWPICLALFISPLKPQLELDRMFLVATLIAALPAALSINYIWDRVRGGDLWKRGCGVLVGTLLLVSLFSTTSILHNRHKQERYYFLDEAFLNVGEKIKRFSKGGRALFPGFILHDLSQTHIAPLIFSSQVPLVANYPFHQVWRYSEAVPPYYQEKGLAGVEDYFDLMNADLLVVREPRWIQFMNDNREYYRLRGRERNFLFYSRRKADKNWFLEGTGEIIEKTSSGLKLQLKSDSAVIKFNYFPFLEAKGCSLEPRELPGNLTFIRIYGCTPGQKTVEIKSVPVYKRIINEIMSFLG